MWLCILVPDIVHGRKDNDMDIIKMKDKVLFRLFSMDYLREFRKEREDEIRRERLGVYRGETSQEFIAIYEYDVALIDAEIARRSQ